MYPNGLKPFLKNTYVYFFCKKEKSTKGKPEWDQSVQTPSKNAQSNSRRSCFMFPRVIVEMREEGTKIQSPSSTLCDYSYLFHIFLLSRALHQVPLFTVGFSVVQLQYYSVLMKISIWCFELGNKLPTHCCTTSIIRYHIKYTHYPCG